MTPVIGIVIFLVLFAVLMVAVGLGSRFLELRGKKQMETILNPTTDQVQEVETSILVAPTNRDPLDAFLERSQLQNDFLWRVVLDLVVLCFPVAADRQVAIVL